MTEQVKKYRLFAIENGMEGSTNAFKKMWEAMQKEKKKRKQRKSLMFWKQKLKPVSVATQSNYCSSQIYFHNKTNSIFQTTSKITCKKVH